MGSVGNQINPWAPYDNYRDCSQEICSIYCPQFCYLIFPPPPPSDQDGSNTPFSPLIIAIIGVLASALVLVSYYTIVTRFCRKRRRDRGGDNSSSFEAGPDELAHDHPHGNNGLDENLIKTITVCKYQRGDGLIEGTECAVCLSEFRENESLRLLPKCSHAFHLPCIDTWLKSQSNCPLCRASVIAVTHLSPENCVSHQVHSSQDPSMAYYDDGVSSYEVQRPDDLVLVMDDREMNCRRDDVVMSVVGNNEDHSMDLETRDLENARNNRERCRRSVSFGTLSSQRQLLISDILRIEELDEDSNMGCDGSLRGIGSSKGISGLIRSPLAMRRSVSTGRFVFNVNDKGKTSAFQH